MERRRIWILKISYSNFNSDARDAGIEVVIDWYADEFEVAGAAENALTEAKEYVDNLLTWGEISETVVLE